MKLPDYLIIGETKCGTTSFYNYLIQHPKILDTYGNGDQVDEIYRTKEIRFFDRYFDRGVEWYKSCFPDTKEGEITGEATPMYMYRTLALFRIKQVVPQAKFIIQLRNPVDRLYSNYQHYHKWVPGFKEKYRDFAHYLNSARDTDYFLIDKGIYVQTIERWFSFFPEEQFFIFSLEELQQNPQKVYSAALKFLGVEDFRLSKFESYRALDYSPMEEEIRNMLIEFYYPFNQKLYRLLNRKFDWDK